MAQVCVEAGRSFISASYSSPELEELDEAARRQGVLVLPEMGLDPGIDVMMAAELITRVRAAGGTIRAFESYGSGVPATDDTVNPMRYVVTWNPRNVVMAAAAGAQFLEDGSIRMVPWQQVFGRTWPVDVPGVGTFEGYANRDSLSYIDVFGLEGIETMIRGTLRYPGYCEVWGQIARLGLPTETLSIPNLAERSFAEILEMFLPPGDEFRPLEERVAAHLGISPTGRIMDTLRWLGLFSTEPCGAPGSTPAEALIHLLRNKLALPDTARDMVMLHNVFHVTYEDERSEQITSTLVERGEAGGMTAMSKTVGLPAAIAVKLLLTGKLPLTGCQLPTEPLIYEPVLAELREAGITLTEQHTTL